MPIIPITRPLLGEEEISAIGEVIRSGWITQGPQVEAFEKEFAAMVGADHACAVSNCTTALYLALLAVGVQAGDEVITVSQSFIATANSIRYCGGIPVFVDISPEQFNIDPALIEPVINERTKAILCVHQIGMPCDLRAIIPLARRFRLPVIEDAACAVGSQIAWNGQWESIGKPHGDIACFSFHPRKLLTTGEGGMLTTSRSEWDSQFRLWRQHGMSHSDIQRHQAREVMVESYTGLGFNCRLTDLQAVIGREQLKRLPSLLADRRQCASRYRRLLARIPGITWQREPAWARSNWQSFCVRLPDWCDQKSVMRILQQAGIASRRGIMCAHREPAFAPFSQTHGGQETCFRTSPAGLAESEMAQDRTILLPLYPGMTEEEQGIVVESLRRACRKDHAKLLAS